MRTGDESFEHIPYKQGNQEDVTQYALYSLAFTFNLHQNAASNKLKCKKAMEQGNMEGARIFAESAIRDKNTALNCKSRRDTGFGNEQRTSEHGSHPCEFRLFLLLFSDLRLSSRIDAVAQRVNTAVKMQSLTKDMSGIVKSMDQVMKVRENKTTHKSE